MPLLCLEAAGPALTYAATSPFAGSRGKAFRCLTPLRLLRAVAGVGGRALTERYGLGGRGLAKTMLRVLLEGVLLAAVDEAYEAAPLTRLTTQPISLRALLLTLLLERGGTDGRDEAVTLVAGVVSRLLPLSKQVLVLSPTSSSISSSQRESDGQVEALNGTSVGESTEEQSRCFESVVLGCEMPFPRRSGDDVSVRPACRSLTALSSWFQPF